VPEERITDRYGVGPGDVRGKTEAAEWLLEAAERLSGTLGLGLEPAISRARRRVADGVTEELLSLAGVREVGRKRARKLYDAGIESPSDLRNAPKPEILRALDGRQRTTETILDNAGRADPSIDDGTLEAAIDGADEETLAVEEEGQSALGDF
jgi:helicase